MDFYRVTGDLFLYGESQGGCKALEAMDYLEGFLIGPVWSDTDYKTHRHFSVHLFLAFLMALLFADFVFNPSDAEKWVLVPWPGSMTLLIIFVVITPFLSSYYYRMPVFVRPLVLLLYASKYVLLFYVLTHYFLPMATLDLEALPMMILERMDSHVNTMIDKVAGSGGIMRTVVGIVLGTLWLIGEGLLFLLVVIAIPLMAIGLLKGLQFLLDWIVSHVFYPPLVDGLPVNVPERFSPRERRLGAFAGASDEGEEPDDEFVDLLAEAPVQGAPEPEWVDVPPGDIPDDEGHDGAAFDGVVTSESAPIPEPTSESEGVGITPDSPASEASNDTTFDGKATPESAPLLEFSPVAKEVEMPSDFPASDGADDAVFDETVTPEPAPMTESAPMPEISPEAEGVEMPSDFSASGGSDIAEPNSATSPVSVPEVEPQNS